MGNISFSFIYSCHGSEQQLQDGRTKQGHVWAQEQDLFLLGSKTFMLTFSSMPWFIASVWRPTWERHTSRARWSYNIRRYSLPNVALW